MMLLHILRLTLLRLWRARATVSCQALALFAMMAPLLIILGLKYGIVESMKERLLSDPASLEVRMVDAVDATPELMDRIRSWPETAFATPCVGALYSRVFVCACGADEAAESQADMLPTGHGDPLLQASQQKTPAPGEVVISEDLARQLQLGIGEQLCLRVRRNMRQELFERAYTIVGVLPRRHLMRPALLLPLEMTVEVENFIIAGRGIPGSDAQLTAPVYDGIVLGIGRSPHTTDLLKKQYPNMTEQPLEDGAATDPAADGLIVRCDESRRLTPTQVDVLVAQAEAEECAAWPWVEPQQGELLLGGQRSSVRLVSLPGPTSSAAAIAAPPSLLIPPGSGVEHVELFLPSPQGESRIVCRAVEDAAVPQGEAWCTPQILALARLGSQRCLVWDYRTDALRFPVLSFVSMRVYANALENTEPLLNRLLAEGIACRAQLGVIRQILSLEHNLSQLFAIITFGAGIGALVSYALSLFNAAELNRRDYALVQLLGAGRGMLACMPMVEALITSLISLVFTFACFYATSSLIGLIFEESAGRGALCRIAPHHALLFCLAGIGVACVASAAAAFKVLRISPAEILRES